MSPQTVKLKNTFVSLQPVREEPDLRAEPPRRLMHVGLREPRCKVSGSSARTISYAPTIRVRGGFLSFLGVVSYRIRILMYRDVSSMYPVGYTYLECILMYLKCILNALLHSKRIHVS